ncbi:ubiquitin carboxyl-terminal hydrolase [Raphidocelis subcapitata]|uniref:ubiquitinyl hydrolase 1 n=1 Tax=Raphidocelis subcapitata TaxID=307507 RepID=A0A2V0NPB5_9CHLO|nr:ubiquitin carboxyl-terminal hydrolase [Raphidocelis subcapitata]|eukprot:GBF87340.1 ubiquitin carboxyl-terminal hydrolase [Raphidocelis subcapitata]
MSPFLSSSVLRAAALPRAAGAKRRVTRASAHADAAAAAAAPPAPGAGFLARCCYGVVSHRGDMSAGHYVAYVRAGGSWYKCDDAWVMLADGDAEVARCQAYLLFYEQRAPGGGAAAAGGPCGAAAAAVAAAAKAANAAAAGRGG